MKNLLHRCAVVAWLTRGLALVLLLAAPGALSHANATDWRLIDLAPMQYAAKVNNRGDVAGGTETGPALWRNGSVLLIANPEGGIVQIRGMNEDSQLVGTQYDPNTADHIGEAWTWKNGQWTDLGFKGSPESVNNFGQIVGYEVGSRPSRAVALISGVLIELPGLGGESSAAYAINDRGDIAGYAQSPDGALHAVMWKDRTVVDLGTSAGNYMLATDINNHGDMVGWAIGPDGYCAYSRSRDYIGWLYDGSLRTLPYLHVPAAINNHGDVVGDLHDGRFCSWSGAFLLEDGQFTRLEQLAEVAAADLTLLDPVDVSDRLWIVMQAYAPGTPMQSRAFLLVPQTDDPRTIGITPPNLRPR